MEFWLKNDRENINMLLPITPQKYDIDYGIDIETVGATAIGDINIPTYKKLLNVTLEGVFSVNEDYPFLNKKTYDNIEYSIDYVNLITSWIETKDIIRLVITEGTQTKINAIFYIEAIKYSEDNTSNGDINYTITLREYKPLKTITIVTTVTKNKDRTTSKIVTKNSTYIVVAGDSLIKIARKLYGNSTKSTLIYNANKNIIKNPNLIYVGQKLIIP